MGNITAVTIKEHMEKLGADLCQIAAVERFTKAPSGFHPDDIFPGCQSVVVFAVAIPKSIFCSSSQALYTFAHLKLFDKLNSIALTAAMEWEKHGISSVPVPASDPYEYWDESRRRGQGILSLKHAAVQAGLGKIGKNTLLLNEQFGNRLLLGAILLKVAVETDQLSKVEGCLPNCRICLDSCPSQALDGITIDQSKCRAICGKSSEGGGFIYSCNMCRTRCPKHLGR
ncbi:MAG: hypothetical protein E6713_12435 [Sporomusaceae bacterium]|nr:hypothetical protein [Sporomusaceae bacterium]